MGQGIAVLGLGIENLALADYLLDRGKHITVCDSRERAALGERYDMLARRNVDFRLGPSYLEHLEDFEVVYRSPGLPLFEPNLERAAQAGVYVTSAMRLFIELCPCTVIGVTGSKGKGTTSSLIHRILQLSQAKVDGLAYLGGNIGVAPFEFYRDLRPDDVVILELSSFQLEDMDRSVDIAVVTNITEDHLAAADPLNPNYHKSRAEYVTAKANLFRHQDSNGIAILNCDDPTSRELSGAIPGQLMMYGSEPQSCGAWFVPKSGSEDCGCGSDSCCGGGDSSAGPSGAYTIWWNVSGEKELLIESDRIQVRGLHNLSNICAAALAAHAAGADPESIVAGIEGFTGLEHRLEYCGTFQGVEYYDDSFATNPDPTIIALRAFDEPVVLIAGGADKGADYTQLAQEILNRNIRALLVIGLTGPKIRAAVEAATERLHKPVPEIIDGGAKMSEIVQNAAAKAQPGDVVLLSTACASFGMFPNYKVRGNQFKEEARKLGESMK
jgi:UDP-N-acetylmuramoylalanine--D-glutamate ligase